MRFENGLFQITPEFIRASDEISREIAKSGELVIAGYATTFDKGLDNAVISPQAVERAPKDLSERSTVLFNHNQDLPIGRIHEAKLDDKGLFVTVLIDKSEQTIQEKIKSGTLSKFSIRGRILSSHEKWDENTQKSISIIDKLKLLEVSVVSVPAVDSAEIQSWYVKRSAGDDDFQPLQRSLQQGGDSMSDESKKDETLREKEQVQEEPKTEEVNLDDDELVEAVESSQLELLLDLDERVSTMLEKMDEISNAANIDSVMRKLEAIEALLKRVWDKMEKYPYPYPAKSSAPAEEESANAAEEDIQDLTEAAVGSEVLETVRALAEDVKELKETVVIKGEKGEPVQETDTLRGLIESEDYKKADPSEKLRLIWEATEKAKGGE